MSTCSSPSSCASYIATTMQCNSDGAEPAVPLPSTTHHRHAITQERTTDPFQSLLEAARIHLLSATGASTSPSSSSPCLSPSPPPPSSSSPPPSTFASIEPEVTTALSIAPSHLGTLSASASPIVRSPPTAVRPPHRTAPHSSSSSAQPLKLKLPAALSSTDCHREHKLARHHLHTSIPLPPSTTSTTPTTHHHSLRCEMNTKALDMRRKSGNDPQRCRSLVCDSNGIIVAEMVYRCMICFHVSDSMTDAQQHYLVQHIEEEDDDVRMKADDILDTEMECNTSVLNKVKKTMPYTKMLQPKNNGSTGNNDRHTSQTMMREPGRKSIAASRTHFAGSSDSNSAEDTPIDMSPNSDSYEPYGSIGQLNDDHMQFDVTSNASKSGYVNCAVCNVTRFYSCVQRRYGQFTCVTCYRYFRSFMLQPKRYSCPRLGECLLNVRTRCRACWIKACIDLFTVDAVRKQIIEANRPLRRECSPAEEDEQMLDTLDDGFANDIDDDEKLDTSDDNNNSLSEKAFNNLIVDLPSLLSKAGGNGFGLLNYPSQLLGFGQLNADTNNNNPSLMNGSTSIASTNGSLAASTTTTTQIHNGSNNGSSNSAHGLLLAAATKHGLSNGTSNGGSNASSPLPTHNSGASNTTSTGHNLAKAAAAVAAAAASLKQPKVSNSKKIWSCGKCATCVAEDCGKCIYCLDRPKFGGPFIKKQRCIKRRCLMKVKNKGNGPNDSVVNDCEM